jgi:hypothetical protein
MFAYLAYRLNYDYNWYKCRYDECENGHTIGNIRIPMYIYIKSIEIIEINDDHMYINCLNSWNDSVNESKDIETYDKLKIINKLCRKKIINNNGNLKIKVKAEITPRAVGDYWPIGEEHKNVYTYNDIYLFEGGRGYEGMLSCLIPIYKNNKFSTFDIELISMFPYMSR